MHVGTHPPVWYDTLMSFAPFLKGGVQGMGPMEDWEDLRQNVAVSILKNEGANASISKGIMHRKISQRTVDMRRKNSRSIVAESSEHLDRTQADTSKANFSSLESYGDMLELLDLLPDMEKRVVKLHMLEGFSYREIASSIGCSPGRVKSIESRGMDKIRELFNNEKRRNS